MGSNKTQSSSTPVSAAERQDTFNRALNSIWATSPQHDGGGNRFVGPEYVRGNYTDPGGAERLSGGDYDRLEQSVRNSRLAPLAQYEQMQRERLDNDLAKRGVWSSGLAVRAHGDLTDKLVDNYMQAGADAATQRYNLEAQDINNTNQYKLNRMGQLNTLESTDADRRYQSAWRPADYLAGIWNGTGGVISNSSGGGWSI